MCVHVSHLVSVGVFNAQRARLVSNKGEEQRDTKAFEKNGTAIQQRRASLLSSVHLIHPLPVRTPSSVIMRLGVD